MDAAHYDDSDDEGTPPASSKRRESSVVSNGKDVSSKRRRTDIPGTVADGEELAADKSGGDAKVLHDLKDFEEGEEVILTLKDTNILTEEGELHEDIDALESIQLAEMERLKAKLRNKQKKTVYDPTEDWEEGEDGPKKKDILQHYDEWEQENLAARGKAPRPGEAKGFILPNLQGAELDEPAEVQVALLMERQRVLQRAKQRLVGGASGSVPGSYLDETDRDAVTGEGRIKYDASGPTAAIPGEEMVAKQEETAVAFRKLRKKKISKKRQGAAFWKELLSGGAPEEEGEAADDDYDAIQPARQSGKKVDRHHGSRTERQEGK